MQEDPWPLDQMIQEFDLARIGFPVAGKLARQGQKEVRMNERYKDADAVLGPEPCVPFDIHTGKRLLAHKGAERAAKTAR